MYEYNSIWFPSKNDYFPSIVSVVQVTFTFCFTNFIIIEIKGNCLSLIFVIFSRSNKICLLHFKVT